MWKARICIRSGHTHARHLPVSALKQQHERRPEHKRKALPTPERRPERAGGGIGSCGDSSSASDSDSGGGTNGGGWRPRLAQLSRTSRMNESPTGSPSSARAAALTSSTSAVPSTHAIPIAR